MGCQPRVGWSICDQDLAAESRLAVEANSDPRQGCW